MLPQDVQQIIIRQTIFSSLYAIGSETSYENVCGLFGVVAELLPLLQDLNITSHTGDSIALLVVSQGQHAQDAAQECVSILLDRKVDFFAQEKQQSKSPFAQASLLGQHVTAANIIDKSALTTPQLETIFQKYIREDEPLFRKIFGLLWRDPNWNNFKLILDKYNRVPSKAFALYRLLQRCVDEREEIQRDPKKILELMWQDYLAGNFAEFVPILAVLVPELIEFGMPLHGIQNVKLAVLVAEAVYDYLASNTLLCHLLRNIPMTKREPMRVCGYSKKHLDTADQHVNLDFIILLCNLHNVTAKSTASSQHPELAATLAHEQLWLREAIEAKIRAKENIEPIKEALERLCPYSYLPYLFVSSHAYALLTHVRTFEKDFPRPTVPRKLTA